MTAPICPQCRRIVVVKPGWWCTSCSLIWLWEHGMGWSKDTRRLTEAEKAERPEFSR